MLLPILLIYSYDVRHDWIDLFPILYGSKVVIVITLVRDNLTFKILRIVNVENHKRL